MHDPESVLKFWLDDVGPSGWYRSDEALDATIREQFETLWEEAQKEDHLGWTCTPRAMLALLILLDQFPRNMFRGQGKAFSTDALARRVAKKGLDRTWDLRAAEPERQFFYLPLMHSECLGDQERCVRLMQVRLTASGEDNLLHARAHREVIRRFGRFPHRNGDLGRATTDAEQRFLGEGGYGSVVTDMKEAA